jgi:hypothetical protein
MKIVAKQQETETAWPGYTLENGWRMVCGKIGGSSLELELWIGGKWVASRMPSGGWYLVAGRAQRTVPSRTRAVAAWVEWRMSR